MKCKEKRILNKKKILFLDSIYILMVTDYKKYMKIFYQVNDFDNVGDLDSYIKKYQEI